MFDFIGPMLNSKAKKRTQMIIDGFQHFISNSKTDDLESVALKVAFIKELVILLYIPNITGYV